MFFFFLSQDEMWVSQEVSIWTYNGLDADTDAPDLLHIPV